MLITWLQSKHGSGSTATLSPALKLDVWQDFGAKDGPEPKWKASAFGNNLLREFDNEYEAQKSAAKFAVRHLTVAMDTIKGKEIGNAKYDNEDFAYTAALLRTALNNEHQLKAIMSNNFNIILAALDIAAVTPTAAKPTTANPE